MAQEVKQDNPSQEAASPNQKAAINYSLGEAAKLMSNIVQNMRRQWLASAVTTASVLKSGGSVNRGTFDDLRLARENYEELERARLSLLDMDKQAAELANSTAENGGG